VAGSIAVRAVVGSQEADGGAIPGAVGATVSFCLEQFDIGGSDTVGGYRQDAVLALGRDVWFSRVVVSDSAHRQQTRSFAGDAVCGFCQCLDK